MSIGFVLNLGLSLQGLLSDGQAQVVKVLLEEGVGRAVGQAARAHGALGQAGTATRNAQIVLDEG